MLWTRIPPEIAVRRRFRSSPVLLCADAPETKLILPENAMWTGRVLGWRGLDQTRVVDFWRERERGSCRAAVLGRGRVMRERGVLKVGRRFKDGYSMECRANMGNREVQLVFSVNCVNYQFVYIWQAMVYLFVTLVLDFCPPVILDNKGNLIRPQQVSTSCQSLICWFQHRVFYCKQYFPLFHSMFLF